MTIAQNDLMEDYIVKLEYLKRLVNLMNDIYLSAAKYYGAEKKRMHPHRQFCMGTLIVARNNAEAAVNLLEANLVDQIHYISRSLWELTINLYYIMDSDATRDARLERYRRYSDEVLPFKLIKVAKKYPDMFKDDIAEGPYEKKEKRYKDFMEYYKNASGDKLNTQSWNGMAMDKMINDLVNDGVKQKIMELYDLVVKSNNYYLHPSWYYLKKATFGVTEVNRDYQGSIVQMTMIFSAGHKIMEKFLECFPKKRPEFQRRLKETVDRFLSINSAKKIERIT